MVGPDPGPVGFEWGDDSLVGVSGPVGDVKLLTFGTAKDGPVSEDVRAGDVLDVSGVPETVDGGELVLVEGAMLVGAGPTAGQARGHTGGEGFEGGVRHRRGFRSAEWFVRAMAPGQPHRVCRDVRDGKGGTEAARWD